MKHIVINERRGIRNEYWNEMQYELHLRLIENPPPQLPQHLPQPFAVLYTYPA